MQHRKCERFRKRKESSRKFPMTASHTLTLTYPTIFLAVFANQLCLPVPAADARRCS
jgi:hypothetical protein